MIPYYVWGTDILLYISHPKLDDGTFNYSSFPLQGIKEYCFFSNILYVVADQISILNSSNKTLAVVKKLDGERFHKKFRWYETI